MTMNKAIIGLTSALRKVNIPPDLESWLLAEYGWEPCGDLWDAEELMDIIVDSHKQYCSHNLDPIVPAPSTLWKERAEEAKYMLKGILIERDYLSHECHRLMSILDKHGIDY